MTELQFDAGPLASACSRSPCNIHAEPTCQRGGHPIRIMQGGPTAFAGTARPLGQDVGVVQQVRQLAETVGVAHPDEQASDMVESVFRPVQVDRIAFRLRIVVSVQSNPESRHADGSHVRLFDRRLVSPHTSEPA